MLEGQGNWSISTLIRDIVFLDEYLKKEGPAMAMKISTKYFWLGVLTMALGALTAFLGLSFMANPLAGMISLSTLVLLIMAASGIVQILFAFRVRGTRFFWFLLLAGSLSVLLAIIILSSPGATLALLGALLGVQMLSVGASLTTMGIFFKETRH